MLAHDVELFAAEGLYQLKQLDEPPVELLAFSPAPQRPVKVPQVVKPKAPVTQDDYTVVKKWTPFPDITIRPVPTGVLLCKHCHSAFFSQHELLQHLRSIIHSQPVGCPYCSKRFFATKHLTRHLDTFHLESGQFKCDICPSRFFKASNLKCHKATSHINELPHACSYCSIRFKHPSAKESHEKVHFSAREFKCHSCSSTFKRKSSLKRHEITCHNL